jgi:hypothetical protein
MSPPLDGPVSPRNATHNLVVVPSLLCLRQLRAAWRSRRLFAVAGVMAVSWLARPEISTPTATLWSGFFTAMLAAAVAGGAIIAQEFEAGAMALQRLHRASPGQLTAGSLMFLVLVTLLAFLLWVGSATVVDPEIRHASLTLPMAACMLALAAWCTILVFFGSVLPGYGNVAVAGALVVFGAADRLGRYPVVSRALEVIRDLLPLPRQAAEILRKLQAGRPISSDVLVLVLGSLTFVAATILVLRRRDPSRGWRR